jgi:hypothetical protein
MSEMFGLPGPLNKRDKSATSFADLFKKLSAPRPATDMPKKLPRPSLANPVVSAVAGVPIDPADEPLSPLAKEWLEGTIKLTAKSPAVMALGAATLTTPPPSTQGAASDFVEARLKKAFNI